MDCDWSEDARAAHALHDGEVAALARLEVHTRARGEVKDVPMADGAAVGGRVLGHVSPGRLHHRRAFPAAHKQKRGALPTIRPTG